MPSVFQDELSWLKLASREHGFIAGGSRCESGRLSNCFCMRGSFHISTVTTSEERLCVSRGERGSWTIIIENPELLVLKETLMHLMGPH